MGISFVDILRSMGCGVPVLRLAAGDIRVPHSDLHAPPEPMGHPPALVPILGGLSVPRYYGLWRHWFVDREPSFVCMHVWAGSKVDEIARTEAQFITFLLAKAIVDIGELDDEIERFAAELGVTDLATIDRVTDATGDDPKGLVSHPAFNESIPLASSTDRQRYDGGFPIHGRNHQFLHSCSFELDEDSVGEGASLPSWLRVGCDIRELFYSYVDQGDFDKAWLALNSTGWAMGDAHLAIARLSAAAGDIAFARFARCWCAGNGVELGGY